MRVYQEATDEELFSLLKQDLERAFDELFRRYWDRSLELAYVKLQSQEEAEDVVLQVFMNIWANRAGNELRFTFRTYLSAAIRYVIYRRLAERKRSNEHRADLTENLRIVDDSTQEWLHFRDVSYKLDILLDQLPEKCEMVFRLSREEGLSNKEIAEKLNISVKTVEMHITKAIKAIKSGINQPWMF